MTENEIKILGIDVSDITARLGESGFEVSRELFFRRVIYNVIPQNPNEWIRLRTDGEYTTLTYKKFLGDLIDGVEEVEVEVASFDQFRILLGRAGLKEKSYQENRRVLFRSSTNPLEVSIDFWPKIPPYLEIEGESPTAVEAAVTGFKLEQHERTSATTEAVYSRYGIDLASIRVLTFSE